MTKYLKQLSMLFVAVALSLSARAQDIVTRSQVGAKAMPDTVAPITGTPFKMKSFKVPVFPKRQTTVSTADRDSRGMITFALNNKISTLSKQGGGTVIIPAGHWLTGRVTLRNNINLHLEQGAVLEFSADIADYQPAVFTRHEGVEVMGAGAFIYANEAKNIALTGQGTIQGPPMDALMRTLRNGNSVVEKDIDYLMPVKDRICDGQQGRTFYRPKSFSPINCKNVLVEGVTFERSVLWNVNPVYCENVIIRGITVNSTNVPSGDGIDISSCRNVLIEYSTLNCGDDCFTLKSGRCEDGLRVNRPTENVVIRYCLAKDGHGGITCGSETAGGIRNVYLHDCVFDGTRTGFRFKTRRNRGGTVEGITYDRIRLINMREAFTWDLLGVEMYMGELARRNPPMAINRLTPTVKDITISNFIVESADRLITINAIPEIPTSGVVIKNGTIRTNRIIRTLNDADGVTFKDLTITATDPTVVIDNSRNIVFDNVRLNVPGDKLNVEIKGNNGEGKTFK